MEIPSTFQDESPFFRLPKEIRVVVYELVIKWFTRHKQIKIGHPDFNAKDLTPWPMQPPISRVCRLTRSESLEMYYSNVVFVLNIQRPSGEDMVISWIERLATAPHRALNKIQNVSIITGWGNKEPPKEYLVNVQRAMLILATRPCAAAYLYTRRSNMRLWSKLALGPLKRRLLELPTKTSPGFNVAQNLREIIAVVGELSGYGLYNDFPLISNLGGRTAYESPDEKEVEPTSHLLNLPKELRLTIYEHLFSSSTPVTIGQRAISRKDLTDWQNLPSLTHTSSLLRQESLPMYFAYTHFILNIQRTQCEQIVQDWIRRCCERYPTAFQNIQHVSVAAGSGIKQPPRQYEFYIQQSELLSTIDRPVLQPYTLPANRWSPPPWEQLQSRMVDMPKRGDKGFDAAMNLRAIIDVLGRYSD